MTPSRTSDWPKLLLILFVGLSGFAALGSVLSAKLELDGGWAARLSSVALILVANGLVFQTAKAQFGKAFAWRFVGIVFLVGMGFEIVGLYTGLPFGRYAYSSAWWPTVGLPGGGSYPLLLPFAWVMVAGSALLAGWAWKPGWVGLALGALVATLVDVPMEAGMTTALGYWEWIDEGPVFGAPVLNSVGWFVVTFLAGGLAFWGQDGRGADALLRLPWVVLGFHLLVVMVILLLANLDVAAAVSFGFGFIALLIARFIADDKANRSVE